MKHEVTRTKTALKLAAILIALIVAMTLWSVFVDKAWPARAQSEYCTVETPCSHPKAADEQTTQYRQGKLHRTRPGTWDRVISAELRHKMKRAYARYTQNHPYGPYAVEGTTATAAAYDWPSPKEWFRSFASSVGCGFVGTTGRAVGAYCSSGSNDMADKTGRLANEVGRVTVKCGGDMVLGGLANDSATEVARKMGWRLSGGLGFYAAGAHCAWNNYFNEWWWN